MPLSPESPRAPALGPAIAFVAGAGCSGSGVALPVFFSLAGLILSAWLRRREVLATCLVLGAFVSLGAASSSVGQRRWARDPLRQLVELEGLSRPSTPWRIEARLVEPVDRLEDRSSLELEVRSVRFRSRAYSARSRLRVSVRGEFLSRLAGLRVGDNLRLWTRLSLSRPYLNDVSLGSGRASRAGRGSRSQLFGSTKSALLVEAVGPPHRRSMGARWLEETRGWIRSRILSAPFTDRGGSAVALALVLGERAHLDPELVERYRQGGLLHVLAISGAHVAFWIWLVDLLLKRLVGSFRLRHAALIVFVVLYALLCEGRPSVVRASFMASAFIFGRALSLDSGGLNALSLAAIAAVAYRPQDVFEPGFQLSFAATLTILLFFRRIRAALWFTGPMARPLSLSLSAQLGIVPVLAYHFHQWVPSSIITTTLAMPLAMVVMISAALLCVSPSVLQVPLVWIIERSLSLLGSLSSLRGEFGDGLIELRAPEPWWFVAYGGVVLALMAGARGSRVLIALLTLVGILALPHQPAGRLEVHVLDVGHGDSILIGLPDGDWVLVDAGGSGPGFDVGERLVAPSLMRPGIHELSALILTHEDRDHIGGMASVARRLDVREFWRSEESSLANHGDLLESLRRADARQRWLRAGERFRFGGVLFEVVAAGGRSSTGRLTQEGLKRNDSSVVLRLSWAGRRVLLTGDIEHEMERHLLSQPAALRADVLKVAHHGSASSSGLRFLSAVNPQLALVSTRASGLRPLPAPSVMSRLHQMGIETLRTDRDGSISVVIEPSGAMTVSSARQRAR